MLRVEGRTATWLLSASLVALSGWTLGRFGTPTGLTAAFASGIVYGSLTYRPPNVGAVLPWRLPALIFLATSALIALTAAFVCFLAGLLNWPLVRPFAWCYALHCLGAAAYGAVRTQWASRYAVVPLGEPTSERIWPGPKRSRH